MTFTGEESTVSPESGEAAGTDPAEASHDDEPLSRTSTHVSSTTAVQGQEMVTLKAAVSAPEDFSGLPVNAGVVTFVVESDAGLEMGAPIFALVSEGSATAQFPMSEFPVGSYTIRATYDPEVGNAHLMGSSATEPGTLVVRESDATRDSDAALTSGSLVKPSSTNSSSTAAAGR